MDITLLIALGSAVFAGASAYVAIRVAWDTRFKPAKLVGAFPYIVVWTFYNHPEGKVSDRFMVPMFWLSNVGAKPIVICDLRIVFDTLSGGPVICYPIHTVPREVLESPATFSDYGTLSAGKSPFAGFRLANMEKWLSVHSYFINDADYQHLTGETRVAVEVKECGGTKWQTAIVENIHFDRVILKGLKHKGSVESEYFYSGIWKERTRKGL